MHVLLKWKSKTARHRALKDEHRWLLSFVVCLGLLAAVHTAAGDEFLEGFENSETSWQARTVEGHVTQLKHGRVTTKVIAGSRAESFVFEVTGGPASVVLEHKLPVARIIDDLKLKLMVRSSTNGVRAGFRVVFPRQTDPRNGRQLKTTILSGAYSQAPKWQELTATLPDKLLQEQLRLLRATLKPNALDLRDPVVDRVIVELTLDNGLTEIAFDELRFGPLVRPVAAEEIRPTQFVDDSSPWQVSFQLDRLLVGGRPFFPRLFPYHGESAALLREAGFNVVWIPDANDVALQHELQGHDLWTTAVPPRLESSDGKLLRRDQASLPPIPRTWDNILAWNLGVALDGTARDDVLQWLDQVQSADHDRHRPILADVVGGERVFSRHVAMLGSSRHILNSSSTFKSYREWLDQRRKVARPGTFLFTWLPTEPMPDVARQRHEAGRIPMIVEPEQLRLLTYSSLAAGCRGLGFSLSEPLDSKAPGADERRLAMTLLNLELALLEDFLAGGTLVEHRPFKINAPPRSSGSLHNVAFRNSAISRAEREARLAAHKSSTLHEGRLRSELEAAVFRTDKAVLLLPIWYENDAQFVPGQLAAPGATLDVSSVPDTASAWEVSTTRVVNLPSEPIPGGRRIQLPYFDTTAAIVVTSDQQVVLNLRRKMEAMQAQSARLWIDLAKAKLNRVRIADEELRKWGVGQPDAPQLLAQARRLLQDAESKFPGEALDRLMAQSRESGRKASSNSADVVFLKKNFDAAAQISQASMQTLRILQKAHWETATHRLASPVGSPHTLCFQTLPDHWRLVSNLGKSGTSATSNLLPKGDFEVLDFATLARAGWQNVSQSSQQGIRTLVQVQPAAGRDSRCLRLVAAPETNTDAPSIVESPPIKVVSPPVPVRAGQILHVSGWVRVVSAVSGSLDGVTLSDNLTGQTGAWQWSEKREWQRIEMLREAYRDGDFVLTITLHGIGDVQFDDLQVIAHDPPEELPPGAKSNEPNGASDKPGRFDFWQRLPLSPFQRKP